MVYSCCADGCSEKYSKESPITFHSFPKDPIKRRLWMVALKKDDCVFKDIFRVCSKHFTKKDYNRKIFGGTWLKPDAVPKLFNRPPTNSERSLLFPLDINMSDDESSSSSSNSQSYEADLPKLMRTVPEILNNLPSSLISERAVDVSTAPSSSSNLPPSPISERPESGEDTTSIPHPSEDSSSIPNSERAESSKDSLSIPDSESGEDSSSSTSEFESLLTPIKRDSDTEDLYKASASHLGTTSSKRTSLFRLAKKCAPIKFEIEDSSITKHIKENDPKHIRYLEYLSRNANDINDDESLSASMRWEIAKQQKELQRRSETARQKKKRLRKSLKNVRSKITYMKKLNSQLETKLKSSTN